MTETGLVLMLSFHVPTNIRYLLLWIIWTVHGLFADQRQGKASISLEAPFNSLSDTLNII